MRNRASIVWPITVILALIQSWHDKFQKMRLVIWLTVEVSQKKWHWKCWDSILWAEEVLAELSWACNSLPKRAPSFRQNAKRAKCHSGIRCADDSLPTPCWCCLPKHQRCGHQKAQHPLGMEPSPLQKRPSVTWCPQIRTLKRKRRSFFWPQVEKERVNKNY